MVSKNDIAGISLSDMIDSFEPYVGDKNPKNSADTTEFIKDGYARATEIYEDLQEIIDDNKDNPMQLAKELQNSPLRIKLTTDQLKNDPEGAVIKALNLRGNYTEISQVIASMEAVEKLADSFPGMFDDMAQMMQFLHDNRDAFDQSAYGIDANGAQRPAMNDMSFTALVQSGTLNATVDKIIAGGADISIAQMSKVWGANPDNIDKTFLLNNGLEDIANKSIIDSVKEFLNKGDDNSEALKYANSVYGSDAVNLGQFVPFIKAQDALAAEHFGGDKVKMAEFFVENPVSAPDSNMRFADFVNSGKAGEFVKNGHKLNAEFNAASGADKPAAPDVTQDAEIEGPPRPEADTKPEEADNSLDNIADSQDVTDALAKLEADTQSDFDDSPSLPPGQSTSGPHVTITDITDSSSPQDTAIAANDADAQAPDVENGIHNVVAGDKLDHIIQDHYDTDPNNPLTPADIVDLRNIVADVNNKDNANMLSIGEKVTLPSNEEIAKIRAGEPLEQYASAAPQQGVDQSNIPAPGA